MCVCVCVHEGLLVFACALLLSSAVEAGADARGCLLDGLHGFHAGFIADLRSGIDSDFYMKRRVRAVLPVVWCWLCWLPHHGLSYTLECFVGRNQILPTELSTGIAAKVYSGTGVFPRQLRIQHYLERCHA